MVCKQEFAHRALSLSTSSLSVVTTIPSVQDNGARRLGLGHLFDADQTHSTRRL
ncbi:MAG: hypothetical protein IPQ00_18015 [Chloracidobacterium sp.]|nr:hypothetical protein [Chloracidobacterium sp.]